jgi:NADH pyrophosphatase NudC (nudix superfamily)
MNFYLVTYAINFVKVNDENIKEDVAHVRFFDSQNFANSHSFLASLKQVKKLRITSVEWDLEECSWYDYYEDISNTIH